MNKPKLQPLTTGKLTTTTYKTLLFILSLGLLIYIHDAFPKDAGQIGLSSVRVYLYTVLAEIRFLAALFFIYILAKGKQYRFFLWLPITLTTYQAIIRIFALQKTGYNELNPKIILTIIISIILAIYYLKQKRNEL